MKLHCCCCPRQAVIPGIATASLVLALSSAASAQIDIVAGYGGTGPSVRGFTYPALTTGADFFAFDPAFQGGVRVATGDVNGDGTLDFLTAAGPDPTNEPNPGPRVRVISGLTGTDLHNFLAYSLPPNRGVFVASADVNNDGVDDVITSPDEGAGLAPNVFAYNGLTGGTLLNFDAYPGFSGGVRVAAGDINGDGFADIITGAGAGGNAHVKAFSGLDGSLLHSFLAYPGFNGGVFVAAGDVNGDGRADIITGADGGGSHVKVFDGVTNAQLLSFFAYDGFSGGVTVAAGDLNGDGFADIITGTGPGGGSHVKVFDGVTNLQDASFFAFSPTAPGGVYVAAPVFVAGVAVAAPEPASGLLALLGVGMVTAGGVSAARRSRRPS